MWLNAIVGLAVAGGIETSASEVVVPLVSDAAELHPVVLGRMGDWPLTVVLDPTLDGHRVGEEWVTVLGLREKRGEVALAEVALGEATLVDLRAVPEPGHVLRLAPGRLEGWSWSVHGDSLHLSPGVFDPEALVGAMPEESVAVAWSRALEVPVAKRLEAHPLPVDADRPARMGFGPEPEAEPDPVTAVVLGWQAQALWGSGNAKAAIQAARDAARVDPSRCDAVGRLALWRMRDAGRLAATGLAGTLVRQSLDEAVEQGCLDANWAALAHGVHANAPAANDQAPLANGLTRWRLGDRNVAIHWLLQAHRQGRSREASLALAVVYAQRGQTDAAQAWLSKAQTGDPYPMLTAWIAGQLGLGPVLPVPTDTGPPHLDPEAWLEALEDPNTAREAWDELRFRWPELAVPRPALDDAEPAAGSDGEE